MGKFQGPRFIRGIKKALSQGVFTGNLIRPGTYCNKLVSNFSVQHMSKDTHFLNRTIILSFCSFQLTTFARDQTSLRRIHRVEFCGELMWFLMTASTTITVDSNTLS